MRYELGLRADYSCLDGLTTKQGLVHFSLYCHHTGEWQKGASLFYEKVNDFQICF